MAHRDRRLRPVPGPGRVGPDRPVQGAEAMSDGYHRDDADDERLMTLRGEILRAFEDGLKAGCSQVAVLMCAASPVAELASANGHQDITQPLVAFAGAARSAHAE